MNTYFKLAWRNLWKQRSFTALNIFGLTIAFATAILLGLAALFDLSFDKFHTNGKDIYQVYKSVQKAEGTVIGTANSVPFTPALKAEVAGIKRMTRYATSGINVDLDTKRGRGSQKLIPVTGIVQRDGAVIAEVMDSLGAKKLEALVKKHVDLDESLLITDTYKGYNKMQKIIEHIKIDHSRLYSYNGVNTNTIESFWAIVERGIFGQYHHTSLKYLPKYIVEFCFKYNNRNFDDMFETLVKASMRVKVPSAIIHDPNKPKPKPKPLKTGHLGNSKPKIPKTPVTKTTKKDKIPF